MLLRIVSFLSLKISLIRRTVFFSWNSFKFLTKFRYGKVKQTNVLYFYLAPFVSQPGLVDRLKSIVGCYHIAKMSGYDFKIIYEQPFPLRDYLLPSHVAWEAREEDLVLSLTDTRILNYTGKVVELKRNKQYICYNYFGPMLPELKKNHLLWKSEFEDLFYFSPDLIKEVDRFNLIPKKYIAVHLRFVNCLERFELGSPPLPSDKRELLIRRCKDCIRHICEENEVNIPIVVFSDSLIFLNELKDMPVVSLDGKNVKHLSLSNNADEVLKVFVDFVLISRSNKVYRILAAELYNSNFPVVAAATGGMDVIDRLA